MNRMHILEQTGHDLFLWRMWIKACFILKRENYPEKSNAPEQFSCFAQETVPYDILSNDPSNSETNFKRVKMTSVVCCKSQSGAKMIEGAQHKEKKKKKPSILP